MKSLAEKYLSFKERERKKEGKLGGRRLKEEKAEQRKADGRKIEESRADKKALLC